MPDKKTSVKQGGDAKPDKKPSGKPAVLKRIGKQKQQKKPTGAVVDDRLELMFTIVNRSKAEYYVDLLHSFDVNMQVIALGHGTASADTLAFFGLTDSDKAIIMSIMKNTEAKKALAVLEKKFKTIKNGNGIAYTVPFSGVIGTLIYGFLSNNRKTVKDNHVKEN